MTEWLSQDVVSNALGPQLLTQCATKVLPKHATPQAQKGGPSELCGGHLETTHQKQE